MGNMSQFNIEVQYLPLGPSMAVFLYREATHSVVRYVYRYIGELKVHLNQCKQAVVAVFFTYR